MKSFLSIVAALVILSLTLLLHPATGQHTFTSTVPLTQNVITQWTGDNGLVSNNITSAIQARTGFIWITSYNGIMRFDGRRVDVYDRTSLPFLSTDSFYNVSEDASGVLWFASQGSGLVKLTDQGFERVDPEGKILPKSIRSLLIQPDGVKWVGTSSAGLFKILDDSIHRIDHSELNNFGILDLIQDDDNNLWIGTDGNGVFKYDGTSFTHFTTRDGLLSNTIDALQKDKNGTIWIGTTNGLNIFSPDRITTVALLKNYQINDIFCDANNVMWIGCELGLARMNVDQSNFEFLSEKDGYPLGRVNTIAFDKENSLWVSTGRNGLIQLKETHINNITAAEGLNTNKINIITEAADGSFYIGSDIGVINIYKEGKVETLKFKISLTDAAIRDILVEEDHSIWIASYRGLLHLYSGKEKLYTIEDGLPVNDVRRILKDDDGNLWIGTRSGGVTKFKEGKIIRTYDKSQLGTNYILSLEKDEVGNIYIGTHSGGMTVIKKDGTVTTYHIQGDDTGILIFNIHIDDHGQVWIVTNLGPYYLVGTQFKKINLDKISKGETYFDWIEDHQGSIWITTNIGIIKLNQPDIDDFITGKITSVKTKLYDNQDGMKSKECTGATRSLLASDGRIWVPTIGGICVVAPEKAKENTLLPPAYITSLVVDNEEVPIVASATIKPGKLRFIFNFTAPSFLAPGKINFKYKLAPVDKDWIDAGVSRQVEYTNLAPGNYSFQVLSSNSDGIWNTKEASISFFVQPYFYQTIWFYIIIIVMFILILYGIYRWRIYEVERRNTELRKVNNELDRFVYSASHDLRAPLASILGLVNVARIDKNGNIDDYLDKIEKSVNKLDGFVKDIIDFSRNARTAVIPEDIIFDSLINDVIDDLKYLDEKNQIKRIVIVTGTGIFKTDKKRLTIVLSNLISNSIKYFNPHITDAFLEVTVNYSTEKAIICVRDNGIGIAPQHVNNIFKMFYRGDTKSRGSGLGLYIVKETLDKIGGTIAVSSVYTEGSTFTITIPSLHASKPPMGVSEETD